MMLIDSLIDCFVLWGDLVCGQVLIECVSEGPADGLRPVQIAQGAVPQELHPHHSIQELEEGRLEERNLVREEEDGERGRQAQAQKGRQSQKGKKYIVC
jgi:hypothetical protein